MPTLLLVNPAAGHGRAPRVAAEAVAAARACFGEVAVRETAGPGDGVTIARDFARQGLTHCLVVGGDGTAHEAANGLLQVEPQQRPAFGVIPGGTGNDFAKLCRTLGKSPAAAVQGLARGTTRTIDVGWAWGETFLNSVGIGFDAEVARVVNASNSGSGILAYLLAVAKVLRHYEPFDLELEANGERWTERVLLCEIGNGPVVGGGFRITPGAVFDDGLFDVCVVKEQSILGILQKLPLVMLGKHTRLKGVRSFRTTRLCIRSRSGPLRAQFDGELRATADTMELTLQPAALTVLIAPA